MIQIQGEVRIVGVVYRCGFQVGIDAKVLGCAKFQSVVRSMEVGCFSDSFYTKPL